jgi:cytochrome d ubiquinol oxidase subunit II
LAVAAVAYLAAVYLVWDARRLGDTLMVDYFRRRALVAGAVVAILGLVGIFILRADAPYLFQGLTTRALPLVILSVLC